MRADTPSRTIELPAMMRAAHQLIDERPLVFTDPLAVAVVGPAVKTALLADRASLQSARAKRLRSQFVLRSRFAEDELFRLYGKGVRQYVLIGAGMDTFAMRQPPSLRYLQIFEVDYPSTQKLKLQRLAGLEISAPTNVFYVPADLSGPSWTEALTGHGLDLKKPCFFSCLGVTQYLQSEVVDQIFEFVLSMPKGSAILSSIVQIDADLSSEDLAESQISAARAAEFGEKWQTRFNPAELATRLVKCGYVTATVLDAVIAQSTYFSGRGDGLSASSFELMITATV